MHHSFRDGCGCSDCGAPPCDGPRLRGVVEVETDLLEGGEDRTAPELSLSSDRVAWCIGIVLALSIAVAAFL